MKNSHISDKNAEIFKILIEAQSLVGVYLFNESRFLYINETFANIFGYQREEILETKSPLDLVYPKDRQTVKTNIQKRIKGEIPFVRYIFRGLKKNGSMIYCEAFGQGIVYQKQPAVVGILVDVTEKIEAQERAKHLYSVLSALRNITELNIKEVDKEKLIQKSCELFFKTRDYYGVWAVLLDKKRKVISRAILGFNRKEFKYIDDFLKRSKLPLCAHKALKNPIVIVKKTDSTCRQCDFIKICKAQTMITMRLHCKGNTYGLITASFVSDVNLEKEEKELLQDLTNEIALGLHNLEEEEKRRKTEDLLRKNEQFLQSIFDGIQDGISVLDQEFNILRVNKWMEQMYPGEAPFVGKKCYEVYQKRQSVCPFCPAILTLRTGKPFTSIVPYPSGNEPSRWIELSTFPFKDVDGKIIGVIEHIKDITRRKKAEEEREKLQIQLFQAQKMEAIGTLAGGIAHDLNNLLTPIIGYTELLLLTLDPNDPVREKIESIKKSAEKATSLTSQLLIFSRRQILRREIIDLNVLITELEKMLKRLIGKNIDLITKLDSDLATIKADKNQIEQVIINLIINARDAMPEGGKIIIKTQNVELGKRFCEYQPEAYPGRFVCLIVQDTGIGMDEQTKQRIFEPFFTTKGLGKGTGLGLAIVHGIIKRHKGWIEVYSEPGKGSVFKIYLPVSLEGKRVLSEKEKAIFLKGFQGQGERILVVEDDEGTHKFVIDILSENGYEVIGARNAKEALDIFNLIKKKGIFH